MSANKIHESPESATDKPKLAEQESTLSPSILALLWDVEGLQKNLRLSRRIIHNLRKKGLPTVILGRSVRFFPESVKAWLLRQQRGGVE